MFTPLQMVLFVIASVIIFFSYHAIPNALEKQDEQTAAKGVKSHLFTLFVRFCGTDHLIMGAVMAAATMGYMSAALSWLAVGSIWLVALISMVSAIQMRRL